MSDHIQPAAIAFTAIASIALGFGAATWMASDKADNGPIINPNAWQETAPAPKAQEVQTAQPVSFSNAAPAGTLKLAAAKCSPWEITDVAMEEVLDEMIARGWRPPNQGEAISAVGIPGIAATEPYAPMPYRRTWASDGDQTAEVAPVDAAAASPAEPTAPGNPQPVAIDQPLPATSLN